MEELFEKRKQLRERLLNELYEHHFSGSKKEKAINEEIKDIEVRQAYLYLEEKGYVSVTNLDNPVFASAGITAYGIDHIEEKDRTK